MDTCCRFVKSPGSRSYKTPLSLLLLDVDRLKEINDRGGHEAGDAAIENVAESMRRELRIADVPARFGGDEFAIVLPHVNRDAAFLIATRISEELRKQTNGLESLSVGVGEFVGHASAADLIIDADRALYEAKRRGRNRVEIAEAHVHRGELLERLCSNARSPRRLRE